MVTSEGGKILTAYGKIASHVACCCGDCPDCGNEDCCYFSDFAPDAVKVSFSGILDNGLSCSCHNMDYWLGLNYFSPDTWCSWSLPYNCAFPYGCFGEDFDGRVMEASLLCGGGQYRFVVGLPGIGYSYIGSPSPSQHSSSFGPVVLTPTSPHPSWLAPASVTISGAHGHPLSNPGSTYFGGHCTGCGAVSNRYKVVIAGFPKATDFYGSENFCATSIFTGDPGIDPNGTFSLATPNICTDPGVWEYAYSGSRSSGYGCWIALSFAGTSPPGPSHLMVSVVSAKYPGGTVAVSNWRLSQTPKFDCTNLNNVSLSFLSHTDWSGSSAGSVTVSSL